MTTSRILSVITRNTLYVFIFLIPVFFLPFTSEWLEFNKQYLLYATVSLGTLAWIFKVMVERTIAVKRTFLDMPLIILSIAVLAASIFSKDRVTSFFGLSGNTSWGFVPILFYLLFFFLVVQYMESERHVRRFLGFLVAGAGLSTLYYWGRVFGLADFPGVFPAWNTVQGINSRFSMLLLPPLLIGLTRLASIEPETERHHARFSSLWLGLWAGAVALSIITIVSLGYRSLMIVSAAALGLFLVSCFIRFTKVRLTLISFGFALWIIFILFAVFGTPSLLTVETPIEVSLTHSVSWQTVWSMLKEGVGRLLIGSGPNTFGYDFSAYRPVSFNENFVWSVRFNTPASEIVHQAAGVGVVGIIAWVFTGFLALGVFRLVAQSVAGAKGGKEKPRSRSIPSLFVAVGSAWLLTLALLFFIPFGTVGWVYFFGLLASLALLGELYGTHASREFVRPYSNSPQWSLAASFGAMVAIAALALLGIYLGRFYAADYLYAKGLKELAVNRSDSAMALFLRALRLNNNRYEYHIGVAQGAFKSALIESGASEPNKAKVGQLISAAVGEARRATQLSPRSAAAWETLGGVYTQVRSLTPEATQWALDAYVSALALEPNNPALYLARGLIYRDDKKTVEAKADFEKALALKRNYVPAYLILAQMAEGDKNFDQAIERAEQAAQFARGDLDVAFNLARLYFNRKQGEDLKKSESILKAILARNSSYANAHFTLGAIYEKRGDTAAALEAYKKVLELSADNQEVKDKIAALESSSEPAESE